MPSRQVMGIYTEGVEEEKLERERGGDIDLDG